MIDRPAPRTADSLEKELTTFRTGDTQGGKGMTMRIHTSLIPILGLIGLVVGVIVCREGEGG